MGGEPGCMKESTAGSSTCNLQNWPKETGAVRCPLTLFLGGDILVGRGCLCYVCIQFGVYLDLGSLSWETLRGPFWACESCSAVTRSSACAWRSVVEVRCFLLFFP